MDTQNDNYSKRHIEPFSRTVFKEVPRPLSPERSDGGQAKDCPSPLPKTEKIITALFLVTDIIDKNEPLRTRLRDVGLNILTDIRGGKRSDLGAYLRSDLEEPIRQIISLINIAKSINLISAMNSSILIREFSAIMKGMEDDIEIEKYITPPVAEQGRKELPPLRRGGLRWGLGGGHNSKRHLNDTRKDIIIKLIKDKKEITTKDILVNMPDWGEKTIQRELSFLINKGFIKKTGEKRWSKYSLI